jgi:hypothetical protein
MRATRFGEIYGKGGENMAVVSNGLPGRIRFTDGKMKTICIYSGINPGANPEDVNNFSVGLEMLRGKNFGFKYLTAEAELEDTL